MPNFQRAIDRALQEFDIDFKEESSRPAESGFGTMHRGTLTVRHRKTNITKTSPWSASGARLNRGYSSNIVAHLAKEFPESDTARENNKARGLNTVWFKPEGEFDESSYGYLAHVALRKLCDSPATTLLWRALSQAGNTAVFGFMTQALARAKARAFGEKDSCEERALVEATREEIEALFDCGGYVITAFSRHGSRIDAQTKEVAKKYDIDLDRLENCTNREIEAMKSNCDNIRLTVQVASDEDISAMWGYMICYEAPVGAQIND